MSSLTGSACALHCGHSLKPPQRGNMNNRNDLTELVFWTGSFFMPAFGYIDSKSEIFR
ncbi:hypothetical protein ELI_0911 [Eubacterium callanderi]|uniref:Uncharacterized protein n=1 Tax=Eubacterium callanderi TaxID=53442 RepID=E3GJL5_9FIRM|nr:hypothetical protein ELI_0911 [Eubacterium callanderi]